MLVLHHIQIIILSYPIPILTMFPMSIGSRQTSNTNANTNTNTNNANTNANANTTSTSRLMPLELNRNTLIGLLNYNSSMSKHTLLKLSATWCKPCKILKPYAIAATNKLPTNIECYEIDVDQSEDLYALLKKQRMVNGIPVFLFYECGNMTHIPNDSVTGLNYPSLDSFFDRCKNKGISLQNYMSWNGQN